MHAPAVSVFTHCQQDHYQNNDKDDSRKILNSSLCGVVGEDTDYCGQDDETSHDHSCIVHDFGQELHKEEVEHWETQGGEEADDYGIDWVVEGGSTLQVWVDEKLFL